MHQNRKFLPSKFRSPSVPPQSLTPRLSFYNANTHPNHNNSNSTVPSMPSLLLLLFLLPTLSSSSPLPTIAISRVSNITIICALFPSLYNQPYALNCTSFPYRSYVDYPSGSSIYTAIAAGNGFLCALSSPPSYNTSIMRWWDFTQTHPDAKRVYIGSALTGIASSDTHVCALHDAGSTECWRWPNLHIPPSLNLRMLSVGHDFLCGLTNTNSIRCFGNDTSVVGKEPNSTGFLILAAGSHHACAISSDGDLRCWGSGAPNINHSELDISSAGINSLALGDNRTCARRANGTVICWGDGADLPTDIAGAQFISIQARGTHLCGVLMADLSLVCWGDPVFQDNHLVFDKVLPGTCTEIASCNCGVLVDSGNMCITGKVICQTCKITYSSLPPPSAPLSPALQTQQPDNSTMTLPKQLNSHSNRRLRLVIIASSVGAGVTLVGMLSFLFLWYGKKNRRVHDAGRLGPAPPPPRRTEERSDQPMERRLSAFVSKGPSSTVQEFSLQLLLNATGNFSEDYKIGSGSFGAVYRATLADGREVAIKRAEMATASTSAAGAAAERRRDRESAFISELELLSRVNHRNLVRLIGFCHEGAECVLVYEFMANGTLYDKLTSDRLNSWLARMRVALDAARGIEYLHAYAVPPIIHRDIKSANILLDDSWAAKVADFGLSLMNPDGSSGDESHVSLRAAGTVGYMDPEYYRLQHLTAKSDVYSFGVVLLELLTGCRAVHRYGNSGTPRNVVEFAVPLIEADEVHRILDRRLPPPSPCEIEAVVGVAYIAAECVSFHGRDRPNMTEIVGGLERAVAACLTRPPALTRSTTTRSM